MAAALKHIGSRVTDDEDQARQYAMTAVIMRCCQLLLQMTPFAHDLKALANDCETEPDDQGYYNLLLKAVSSVSYCNMSFHRLNVRGAQKWVCKYLR